jgi:hypothetical protein
MRTRYAMLFGAELVSPSPRDASIIPRMEMASMIATRMPKCRHEAICLYGDIKSGLL